MRWRLTSRPPLTNSCAGSAPLASRRASERPWSESCLPDRLYPTATSAQPAALQYGPPGQRWPHRGVFALVAFLVLLGVWATFAGTILIEAEPPDKADIIVVLAGNAPDRLIWAQQLHAHGYADLFLVSNEPVHTHGLETTWLSLHRAGVSAPDIPDSALLVLDDPPPQSTIEEATRDADLLHARGFHSALLVTDAFHSRRAWLLFRAAFARRGLDVRSVPAPDSLDLGHWWLHPVSARRVLEEWTKFFYYLAQGAYW